MKTTNGQAPALSSNLFPVVGIGASAGGLDAFKKLLKAIPENSGMAYVLVQHLDPTHESLLADILQKITNIPVMEIGDDIVVVPNHIYVIPSNKMLVATDGVLQLTPRPAKGNSERNMPIDLFFTSLAEVHQSHAIGVVLSGSATDGTIGLKAIKDHGGITFAQDEASAAYGSMPNSAVAAGVVDFVLSPEEIPPKLLEVTAAIKRSGAGGVSLLPQDEEVFKQIISLLRMRKGTDFTYYKQTTIHRRILRRMALNKSKEPSEYLKYLKENKAEQDVLYQDLLIPVTSFFRDQKSFDNLCNVIFPLIIKNKPANEAIRIWVAGCSTGEEAYSMAICFKELLGNTQRVVQIFATDISEPAIAKARSGMYTKHELALVTPHRLQEFFTKINSDYQVNKQLRDMCVFATHNFLKDPPFGRMDFISCRNVLIYMEGYLQKKALTTFHYSLTAKGFLLLGKSETTSCVPDLFAAAVKNDKLFSRKDAPGRSLYAASQRNELDAGFADTGTKTEIVRTDFQKTADDIMLSKYTPAGVVVNDAMDIVHFRGNTSNYLQQSSGKPSHHLLKMAKDGLAFELRNLLYKAKKERATVIKENIPLQINGAIRNVSIEAIALPNTIDPYYLILFHDKEWKDNSNPGGSNKMSSVLKEKDDGKKARIEQLENELSQAREDMRRITDDQEAAYEELQSSNEELVSSSEELQSLNEELETNKEELQSTNEELTVVNQEIISLNVQVTEALDYAQAIVATIHEPMIVLDKFLRVKSANASFYSIFRVKEEETKGALLYDLENKQWNIPKLRELLEEIIPKKSQFHDFELTHDFPGIGVKIMLLNASLIVQQEHSEQLILLAIHDVTELRMKTLQLQLKEKELLNKDITERKEEKIRLEKAIGERTKELEQVNSELVFQNQEKEKRAAELVIANKELVFQNEEKEKRAAELVIANRELVFQNQEKEKRAAELVFQNEEKEKRAAELVIANSELVFQNLEKEKRAAELVLQNEEKETRAAELVIANSELVFQNLEKEKRAAELVLQNEEKEKRAAELVIANKELVFQNLEKEKRAAELVLQNEEKEKRAAELVIANKELVFQNLEKEKRAAELVNINKELEAFTYISSHDLQEPLRKIQTFANRILEKEYAPLSEKGKDYFHRMQDAAKRMQSLIEDLLAYSRTNLAEIKFEHTDLCKLIEEVVGDLGERFKEKNAVIEYHSLNGADISPLQFRQLMQNLITNALKFSKADLAPKIVIKSEMGAGSHFKVEGLLPGKEYCHLSFSDNGIGFDPKYKEQIFEVFQRLHGREEYAGQGVGLAIVKKIVEKHNGIITADSEPGKGARFDIYIPA